MDLGGVKLSKKQKLLANNKYTLESQMKESVKEEKMLSGWYQAMGDDNLELIKNRIREGTRTRGKN